jgi:ATP-dependent exoDNAse (exonuclease V) alpha subunit
LREFATVYSGRERGVEQLKKNAPVSEVISLKKNARVMIRVNDPAYQYVNGSVGTVEDIAPTTLAIKLVNGKIVELEQHTFSYLDAEGNSVATATNFPVSLAYAMTIHKSQGVTLDRMVVDLRRLWEPGQAYVALSRLRSGDGLTLAGWDETSIRVDPIVVAFQESIGH